MAKFFWPIDVRINGVPLYSNIAFSANCMCFQMEVGWVIWEWFSLKTKVWGKRWDCKPVIVKH